MKKNILYAIEKKTGLKMKHHHEFTKLYHLIFEATNEHLSIITLMRLWGYVTDQKCEPRITTLDILAKMIGYNSYEQYEQLGGVISTDKELPNSEMFFSNGCNCAKLAIGEEIIVTWQPNRRCRFKHLEGYRFEVIEAENTKISVGDTFDCAYMINNEKLIIDNLCHEGVTGLTYVAGKQGGIHFERVHTDDNAQNQK